jgi:hypothetical protein
VIARIFLALSLVLLVAAPAAMVAEAALVELAEEPPPLLDEEAGVSQAPGAGALRDRATHRASSEGSAPPQGAIAQVFRPPRPPVAELA